MIEVLHPGAASSLQVLPWGRGTLGRAHLGVSAGGPADPLAAAVANRLVDNPARAVVVEMTLQGARLRFRRDTVVALCGAPFPVHLDDDERPMATPFSVRAGQTLRAGACRAGLRCALAVRGGLDDARAGELLRAGDVVAPAGATPVPRPGALPPLPPLDGALRVTPGPEAALFAEEARRALVGRPWRVLPASDRRGLRLDGEGAALVAPPIEMITQGVSAGAVQVPPSGQPIVLFVDQQTTGGYLRIAHVISADLGKLGQLRPGDWVRFQTVDFDTATAAFRAWYHALFPARQPE